MEFGEAFRAVPALQQKRLAFHRLGQRRLQVAGLARKHQRRMGPQPAQDSVQRRLVRIFRHLTGGPVLPTLRGPALGHGQKLHH